MLTKQMSYDIFSFVVARQTRKRLSEGQREKKT